MAKERAEVIARMRKAVTTGQTATDFIAEMRKKGLDYGRSAMLADWREVATIMHADIALSRIRTGYIPIQHIAELKVWEMSREFMYRIKTERLSPEGKRLEPKYINIMSNKPLTVQQIETRAYRLSFDQSPPESGEERQFIVDSVFRRSK